MSLKDAQKDVDDWVSQFKISYFQPLEIMSAITEEVGELAKEVNNRFGPRTKKSPEDTNELSEEMTDVLFNLICMANSNNVDLSQAWKKKMDKQYGRDNSRFEKVEKFSFNEGHVKRINSAESYEELSNISKEILQSMSQPVSMVSGPISSGGRGSIEDNLSHLQKSAAKLRKDGHNVFDNLFFEGPMRRIRENHSNLPKEESNLILLSEFYEPIFKSGHIKKIFFLPDWKSSQGASWEHEKAKELGIERVYLDENFNILENNLNEKILSNL